jgi:hypothetical protein
MEKISVLMGPQSYTGEGQLVTISGTSTPVASAINANFVDITCTTEAYIAFGSTPVASADDYYVVANTTYRFPIVYGDKVAAVQVSSGGTMYAHPVG